MTDDGRCQNEINSRITQAKEAFLDRRERMTKSLEKSTKVKIVKTLVWTTLLYGSETWTLKKISRKWKPWKCGYGEGWKRLAGRTEFRMK